MNGKYKRITDYYEKNIASKGALKFLNSLNLMIEFSKYMNLIVYF